MLVSSDHIGPGQEGIIKAKVKNELKKGNIVKTIQIRTNDPVEPLVIIKLRANVIDTFHSKVKPAEEIFRRPCRRCHVERGIGRMGAELYWADCLPCHRIGKTAPSIEKLRELKDEELKEVISQGVPGTSMPGFSANFGGPLTETQIRTLIRYIKGH